MQFSYGVMYCTREQGATESKHSGDNYLLLATVNKE